MRVLPLVIAGVAATRNGTSSADQNPEAVVRVIGLLEKLNHELDNEFIEEQTMMDKFNCFARDTKARLSTTIDDSSTTIRRLTNTIDKLHSQIAMQTQHLANQNKYHTKNISQIYVS